MKTKMFRIARILFCLCLLSSCGKDHVERYYKINETDKLIYENGHSLIYKDSTGTERSYILEIAESIKQYSYLESEHGPGAIYDVSAEVYAWRLAPAESPCASFPYDSSLTTQCPDCFYCSITASQGSEYGHSNEATFFYNNKPFYFLSATHIDSFAVQGHIYNDVFLLIEDSTRIWVSMNYGILRYEIPNGYYQELVFQ